MKVLSDGKEGNMQPSLIEASRMAKAKIHDEDEARPVIEITDENLRDYSNGGQVFVLESVGPSNSGHQSALASLLAEAKKAGIAADGSKIAHSSNKGIGPPVCRRADILQGELEAANRPLEINVGAPTLARGVGAPTLGAVSARRQILPAALCAARSRR